MKLKKEIIKKAIIEGFSLVIMDLKNKIRYNINNYNINDVEIEINSNNNKDIKEKYNDNLLNNIKDVFQGSINIIKKNNRIYIDII